MLLEGEKYKYILIYSKNNEKSNIKIDFGFDKKIFRIFKFHLVNNTIPIVNVKNAPFYIQKCSIRILSTIFKDEGYQILSLKNDTLIGVLEGPPNTSFENGYFFSKYYFLLIIFSVLLNLFLLRKFFTLIFLKVETFQWIYYLINGLLHYALFPLLFILFNHY